MPAYCFWEIPLLASNKGESEMPLLKHIRHFSHPQDGMELVRLAIKEYSF
jgi:hypothetical protein